MPPLFGNAATGVSISVFSWMKARGSNDTNQEVVVKPIDNDTENEERDTEEEKDTDIDRDVEDSSSTNDENPRDEHAASQSLGDIIGAAIFTSGAFAPDEKSPCSDDLNSSPSAFDGVLSSFSSTVSGAVPTVSSWWLTSSHEKKGIFSGLMSTAKQQSNPVSRPRLLDEIEELRAKIKLLESRLDECSMKHENDALRYQIIQIQEDFYAFQETVDSLKTFFKIRISQLEEKLMGEHEMKEMAEWRVVFLEDKCRFLEEQTQAIVTKLQGEIAVKDERLITLQGKLPNEEPQTKEAGESPPPELATKLTEDSGVEQILKAREEQLERLASQLDATNNLYHKQLDDTRRLLNDLETQRNELAGLQKDFSFEKRSREELQNQMRQSEKSASYRSMLSSSSVPVMVPMPDAQGLRAAPFLIPPQDFLADMRSEIDVLVSKYSGAAALKARDATREKLKSEVAEAEEDGKSSQPSGSRKAVKPRKNKAVWGKAGGGEPRENNADTRARATTKKFAVDKSNPGDSSSMPNRV